eukprot:scaffold90843_cov14-Tisochrysis_lutea.AAC.1
MRSGRWHPHAGWACCSCCRCRCCWQCPSGRDHETGAAHCCSLSCPYSHLHTLASRDSRVSSGTEIASGGWCPLQGSSGTK